LRKPWKPLVGADLGSFIANGNIRPAPVLT
jgi:hypothetical protein